MVNAIPLKKAATALFLNYVEIVISPSISTVSSPHLLVSGRSSHITARVNLFEAIPISPFNLSAF